ncbi:DUF72 domain-containing protein [Anaeromyxobacter paludicola]|uniref:DUF72 domain-containing protein n=1 Tax=Anaeromyxobacter paludicola TaxID=2918171 RepID=A0ABM7XG17_9BACT|nr:DUF72 domain-containing protein [Anaeromyxobacter paludicola]BDG10834.1 hypothetical protein AMPC_39470 [Anaeromyxobacter paludicola]
MIRFGPAGWDYEDWSGKVYPRPAPRGFDPLAYLARYFDAVELNASFYRPPAAKVAESWLRRVEDRPDFRFTLKLWQRFTHERESAWSADDVKAARAAPDAFARAGRLGAVLLQFPWSFKREEANEEWLRDLLARFGDLPLVVEVRHASWNVPETYGLLAERGAGFVNLDQPMFRHSLGPSAVATSAVGYVRVHGRNHQDWFREGAGRDARYDYLYPAAELAPWAERVGALAAAPGVKDVFVVTNNHFEGKAVANAAMLASMVRGERVAAPPDLVAAYRDALAPYADAVGQGQQALLR